MSNKRLITIALVVLILSNSALLIFFMKGKKHHGPKDRNEDPREWIITSLQFDAEQVKSYDILIDQLHRDMHIKREELRHAKDKLYASLIGLDNIHAEKFAMKEVEQIQHTIQLLELQHFKEIKALCNDDQKKQFDKIVRDIPGMFFPQNMKGRIPPPHGSHKPPVPPPPPPSPKTPVPPPAH